MGCHAVSNEHEKGEWLVMDGRARVDTDRASVMEAVGSGVRGQVPRKKVRHWKDYDVCLCFCPQITAGTLRSS